jgi:hypothetical protein
MSSKSAFSFQLRMGTLTLASTMFCSSSCFLCAQEAVPPPVAAAAPAAVPAYKTLQVRFKDSELKDKKKEKDAAKKADKFDIASIDAFYAGYLVPQLTNVSPEVINRTRKEILDDISEVERTPEMHRALSVI